MSSKIARVLELLIVRGDQGLHRFEAAQLAHDSVLPSTVAALHRKGVTIVAEPEDVVGFLGYTTRVARYRIPAPEREHAQQILESLKRKGPTSPHAGPGGTIGGRADATRKVYH